MVPVMLLALALAGKNPIERATEEMVSVEGMWTAWVDHDVVLLRIPAAAGPFDTFILASSLERGLGSNPVGLDRGQIGSRRLVQLRRAGDRVLLEEVNLAHRALSTSATEQLAVTESFATSILASLPVVERNESWLLLDVSEFLASDLHDVAGTLTNAGQGDFSADRARTLVDGHRTEAHPNNLVFHTIATFASHNAGPEVRAVAPDPRSVTLSLSQLWIRLPADGYDTKAYDPRGGFFGPQFADHASSPGQPLQRGFVARHRPAEPIIYYVDGGTPEPMRSALLEGASWWTEAFEAVGIDYRVELLPPNRSAYDVDVNVIQWVHRATRGWSYGDAISDPRTGEILKGHVTLGSQRIRHDRLLFEALLGADRTGSGAEDDPEQLALARLRQLAAHEVGHTLGLRHNFAASTDGRSSVMDYPAPWVRREANELLVDRAYGVGLGAWDLAAIGWGYGDEPIGTIASLPYLSDRDARPLDAASPKAHLWDNGADPVVELTRLLSVRALALERFGEDRVAQGRPLADLRDAFSLVYLLHRYQLEAAARSIGGVDYDYGVRGAGGPSRTVPADTQRAALAAVLRALDADGLRVPNTTTALLLPQPPGGGIERERLSGHAGPIADPLAWAGTAAEMVVEQLLAPGRLQRLVLQARLDPDQLSLDEALTDLWAAATSGDDRDLRFEVQRAVVVGMLLRLGEDDTAPGVRGRIDGFLAGVHKELRSGDELDRWLAGVIVRAREAPAEPLPTPRAALIAPPGSPIGCGWGP